MKENNIQSMTNNTAAIPNVLRLQAVMNDCVFTAFRVDGSEKIFFSGITNNSSIIKRMFGDDYVYAMLINAINNRTRERNYFRLYSELLSGEISEDQFSEEIENNEDDYVVSSKYKPNRQIVEQALHFVPHIKDVNNSEDLSSLFSLDSEETDKFVNAIEKGK